MKTSIKIVSLAVALVAVAAAGYAAGRLGAPTPPPFPSPTPEAAPAPRADAGAALDLAKAESELAALRAERDGLREELAALRRPPEPEAEEPERPRSPTDWMERMKREDPEGYERMQAERKAFHTRLQAFVAEREDFLGNVDESLLTPEQQETHRRFVEAIALQRSLTERMVSGEPLTEEVRRQAFANIGTVAALQEAEREALLGAVATSMGLEAGEQTETFVKVIRSVIDFTGMMPPMRVFPRPAEGQAVAPEGE